jgi:hypothetical protein
MESRKFWLGILATVLIFGMTVIGCDNNPSNNIDNNPPNDTWRNVTNFSQMNGTWRTQYTMTGNVEGMYVTVSYTNYTVTFNVAAKTMAASGAIIYTWSGGNIATLWPLMKAELQELQSTPLPDGVTLSINDANYSYTLTYNNFTLTLTNEDIADILSGFQINQNETKLKAVDPDTGFVIIYTKQ